MASLVTQQIMEQLRDDSHPPIILLNGAWGIGKTHLIEHELKQEIEEAKEEFGDFHYLSAYGMRNVNDFQDQIVSLFLSNEEKSAEYTSKGLAQISNIARIFGADKSEAGLIQGVMSGLTGVVRQSTLQHLSKMTIVLDDLERITDQKIISDILGTCLRFSEHNEIKVIVVANEDALLDKTKVEKTFSDIVTLSRDTEEQITILSEIYTSEFDSIIQKSLRKTLPTFKQLKLDANNLRVIKRAINRIIKLKKEISLIKNIDHNQSQEIISEQIIKVCLLRYSKAYTQKDFIDFLNNNSFLNQKAIEKIHQQRSGNSPINELSEDEKKSECIKQTMRDVFSTIKLNEYIINFCFTNIIPKCEHNELIEKLNLPIAKNPLDQIIKGYFHKLSESDFEKGIEELEALLFKGDNKDYYLWIAGCFTYIELINKEYINKDKKQELKRLLDVLSEEKIIDPLTINNGRFSRSQHLPEELQTEEFKSLIDKIFTKFEISKNKVFSETFYLNWQEAIGSNQKDYSSESYLHYLNASDFCDNVVKWKAADINGFSSHLKERYFIGNAKDWYQKELSFIEELIPKLKEKRHETTGLLKKGTLLELITEFEIILEKLS